MKKKLSLLLIAIFALAILSAGCGKASSPGNVVKDYFNQLLAGKYQNAQKDLSSRAIAEIEKGSGVKANEALKQLGEQLKLMKLEKIQIVKENIKGNTATVEFKGVFTGQGTQPGKAELIKEKGVWKINQFVQ